MGLHNKEGPPLHKPAPLSSSDLESIQGLGRKLWLDEPHPPLPGQPRSTKASGVARISATIQHQNWPQEDHCW